MQTETQNPTAQPLALDHPGDTATPRADLEHLLNANPILSLERVSAAPPATVVDATLPAALPQNQARRRGRIARLPKVHRDLVNRMLANGIPYKNIVAALKELGIYVLERNISRWARGGYLEWRLEQDLVLENRLAQDHLTDHLRREDASEISEVGLQAAATRLSQILLQKTARAENVEANLGPFSQMVDLLARLNREIGLLQKQRDDSRRTLGPAYDAARIKNEEQKTAYDVESDFSEIDAAESRPDKEAAPTLLPPIPTSRVLEMRDLEDKVRQQRDRRETMRVIQEALKARAAADAAAPQAANGERPA